MSEQVKLDELIDSPILRRLWLLHRALQALPLDQAIEHARTAEAFVIGSLAENRGDDIRIDADAPQGREPAEESSEIYRRIRSGDEPLATKRNRLALPTEVRDRLLERLAAGAKNAEVAAEFGLASKQVQGIRMGSARELTNRREQLSENRAYPEQNPIRTTSTEEIVRYLRQQDDVVVPQEDGSYLINGRFRMSVAEIVARANRMRTRQRKPAFDFELPGDKPASPEKISAANGHPLFWERPVAPEPNSSDRKSD